MRKFFQFAAAFFEQNRAKSDDDIQAERLIEYATVLKQNGYSIDDTYTIMNQLAPNKRCEKQLSCNQSDM